MFRAANQRRRQILQAEMRVYLLRDEMTTEGKWTTMHQINELRPRPLYGVSAEELKRTNTALTIIFSGIDETVAQAVHARHVYTHQDILRNKQFVDMFFLFR
jgi:inward rectifier potassium channel